MPPATITTAVGPMAGIISPSMPVFILENKAFGNHAYATLNEGLGKVLRYGALGRGGDRAPALDGNSRSTRRCPRAGIAAQTGLTSKP